jgi:hypothetical protein
VLRLGSCESVTSRSRLLFLLDEPGPHLNLNAPFSIALHHDIKALRGFTEVARTMTCRPKVATVATVAGCVTGQSDDVLPDSPMKV